MSDDDLLINEDEIGETVPELPNKKTCDRKKVIISVVVITIIVLIGAIVTSVIFLLRKPGSNNEQNKGENKELEYEIETVKFDSNIIYIGSHYNYQGDVLLIYKKQLSNNYFVGIADEKGKLIKEVYEIKDGEVDDTYIHRASSFSDGKRVLIGGKILQCTNELKYCDDAKLYDVEFPEQLRNLPTLLYLFTEPIINYGGKYIFWSTFDTSMNIFNFFGELIFTGEKYVIENAKGLTNYFYDLYNKETGIYTLPKILRFGPIKQVIEGGKALSIGGFLNYGLRKGIYQSLSDNQINQITFFEGYDETTSISPDQKLACIMTTRFSNKTSFEIIGLIPTPYSILASYLVSIDVMSFSIGALRKKEIVKGNLGPALVYLNKEKEEKNYKGINLKTDDLWIFNGFFSWSPDGTKVMFDETLKTKDNKRCQIVRLKNYQPSEIKIKDNFNPKVPYARTIEETLNMHLDYPININIPGKSGNLQILHEENKCELTYDNFSEDNEIFYNGKYLYEKIEENGVTNSIFQVNIESKGKKTGNCDFRLMFANKMILFDQYIDGKNKSYGKCTYEGKEINVDIYRP